MGQKTKIEYSWACTFGASYGFSGYRPLSLAKDGVRYNELPVATGMISTSIFFKK